MNPYDVFAIYLSLGIRETHATTAEIMTLKLYTKKKKPFPQKQNELSMPKFTTILPKIFNELRTFIVIDILEILYVEKPKRISC